MAWKGGAIYVPMRHPETQNFDVDAVGRWVQDHWSVLEIVFQNAAYDMGWAWAEWGLEPPERIQDVMAAAYIIDETQMEYNLDAICRRLDIPGKDDALLIDAAAAYFGAKTNREVKENLYRLPARYVGPYGEGDAVSTLEAFELIYPMMEKDDLLRAYQLEIDIMPLVLEMRKRGIPIDVDFALQAQKELFRQREEILGDLSRRLSIGRQVTISDLSSEKFLEKIFTAEQVSFPRTPASKTRPQGTASFKTEWMVQREHWLPQGVSKVLQIQDAAKKFIGDYILGYSHMGRLHAEPHQFKDDRGGTRTTRFAYSNPPLQQMTSPDKHPAIGKIIRDIFLPEDGELWGALDYSQQEPCLTVHFASLCGVAGAEVAVDYYNNDPKPDYHTMVAKLTGMPRPKAKIINLGLAYGMGIWKLAASLGVSYDEAKVIMEKYHDSVPFIRRLMEFSSNLVDKRGYIRLLDGARVRFNRWEPRWRDREAEYEWVKRGHDEGLVAPCLLDEARRRVADPDHPWNGRIKRAFTHKSMNALIQGSAARQTKMAMRECWRQKIIPLLQMHDELDFSFGSQDQARKAKSIMINVVKLRVPVRVDDEFGKRWGSAKKSWEEALAA
jgi:DNA polymerase I-like protein with 3'-5' exonuclease and polymerase domains